MWWEEGLRFTCLGCGRCCRGEPGAIFFTPEEEEKIAEAKKDETRERRVSQAVEMLKAGRTRS